MPHTLHSSFFLTLILSKSISNASNIRSLSLKSSPQLVRYFMASVAWIVPNIPAIVPKTPAVEQVGVLSKGGGESNTQA